MQKLTCREILEATGGKLISGDDSKVFLHISTDSRKIADGDLFIPIVGEKFDGHVFINSALEQGAAGAITQKVIEVSVNKPLILVDDTLKALQKIASYYRSRFSIPFVGITGSVGKTSTKDMIASVLDQKYRVLKTQGNFNNEIGLPLTIFNLESIHEAAVIEMGMSGFGEISRLTAIACPDVAVITNIGLSHIEKLGSRNNILKAKLEILEGLDEDGLVVLNGDDDLLSTQIGKLGYRTVSYGLSENNDYQARNVENLGEEGTTFIIELSGNSYVIHVPVPGIHNVYNALAAIAVAIELGVTIEKAVEGIKEFCPGNMRLNIINHNGIKIINDAYNASPNSMEAAINVLFDIKQQGRTVAVLGDMLEMGDWAPEAHRGVGKYARDKGIDYIITVGKAAADIANGALKAGATEESINVFDSNEKAVEFLKSFLKQDDTVLVKGSRGMKMEQIVEALQAG